VVKENPIGLGSLVIRGFLGQKGIIQFLRDVEANEQRSGCLDLNAKFF
jgi:hypothetical protein